MITRSLFVRVVLPGFVFGVRPSGLLWQSRRSSRTPSIGRTRPGIPFGGRSGLGAGVEALLERTAWNTTENENE